MTKYFKQTIKFKYPICKILKLEKTLEQNVVENTHTEKY